MPQPRKRITGEKAPHAIAINDGSEDGAQQQAPASAPAADAPPREDAPPTEDAPQGTPQPQAAPQGPPDPHLMVELATVEAMLARRDHAQAKMMVMLCVVAGGALILAGAAYYRTAQLMDEAEADE